MDRDSIRDIISQDQWYCAWNLPGQDADTRGTFMILLLFLRSKLSSHPFETICSALFFVSCTLLSLFFPVLLYRYSFAVKTNSLCRKESITSCNLTNVIACIEEGYSPLYESAYESCFLSYIELNVLTWISVCWLHSGEESFMADHSLCACEYYCCEALFNWPTIVQVSPSETLVSSKGVWRIMTPPCLIQVQGGPSNIWNLNRLLKKLIRGRSDKYLASPHDGATIAREIYYRVVHCRRRLLSKFQPNRTRSFVLTTCGSCRVRGF